MKKRFFAVLLALCMLTTLLSISALATDDDSFAGAAASNLPDLKGALAEAAFTTDGGILAEGSLIEAFQNVCNNGTITLLRNINLMQTIALTGKTVTLLGNGYTVTLAPRQFIQLSATAQLHLGAEGQPSNSIITLFRDNDLDSRDNVPLIYLDDNAKLYMYDGVTLGPSFSDNTGVSVYGNSRFYMYGGTITGCKTPAKISGGVYVEETGQFHMYDGVIENCEGYRGGGVGLSSGSAIGGNPSGTPPLFYMHGGTIKNCIDTGNLGGGAVCMNTTKAAQFIMDGGIITGCKITEIGRGGGAIYIYSESASQFIMNGGIISECNIEKSDDGYGGAVYINATNSDAKVVINGSIINNRAKMGGGLFVLNGNVSIGGTITGNYATTAAGGIFGNSGTVIMNSDSKLYGNSADGYGGADLYCNPTCSFTLNSEAAGHILPDCSHITDGWYEDEAPNRWSCDDIENAVKYNLPADGVVSSVALKAAHSTNLQYASITITPANITVYTGGQGYAGVVDDQGQSTTTANGLPQPGFYITLPEELNQQLGDEAYGENLSKILTFTYQDEQGRFREWKLELYGTGDHSTDVTIGGVTTARYVYRLLPGVDETGNQIPIRLQLTDPDTQQVITSDQFSPSLVEQYKEYRMGLYSGGLDTSRIKATLELNGQTVTCGMESTEGTLVVRGLTGEDVATEIVTDKIQLPDGSIAAVAPASGVTYYINGSNVELSNPSGVKLLVDEVLDHGILSTYIQNQMTVEIPAGNYVYTQQYLDLVDTKNGNAYLTISENDSLTIYWKVPDEFDSEKPFYVVHFDALDRNYENLENELSHNPPDLLAAQLVTMNGTQYVQFDTSSFSPFVLVWETKDVPPVPTVTLTYHANDGSEDTLTYYYTDPVVTVKNGLFTRLEYTFDSWNTRPDGTGTTYMPSSTIYMNGDKDLYAQWIKNNDSGHGDSDDGDAAQSEFELHYRTNGGKYLSVESESHVWVKDYEDLPVPVREGYNFEGWYWDFRLTDPVRGDVKIDDPVVVLYAKWTEEKTAPELTGVSRWLDTVNHIAYLSGYPDHSFGSDRNMTRAEVAQMFYSLLLDKDVTITKTFTDVPSDAWYAQAVNTMASLGMLGGYPDGTFQPDRPITRAEFAVVALAFTDGSNGTSCSFTDVNRNDWFYQYVAQAGQYGWMGGYPNGSFRPNNKITRAEVSVIVNNMLERSADARFIDRNQDQLVGFTDLTDSHWAYNDIMEATNAHTYTKDGSTEVWSTIK